MNALYGMIPCQTVRYASLASGALVAYSGMDRTFPQLPPAVHHALAGLAPEVLARMQAGSVGQSAIPLDYNGLCAAGYGFAGAMALPYALRILRPILG